MINILSHCNGVFGIVNKTRQLYMIGQTRIHIDDVDNLIGKFIEIEVSVLFHSCYYGSLLIKFANFKAVLILI